MNYERTKHNPQIMNAKTAKKFFAYSMRSIFHDDSPQCRYSSGDIVRVIRNAISLNECIETYVRNNSSVRTPSGDTVLRWIKDIGSESGSHRRNGPHPGQRTSIH